VLYHYKGYDGEIDILRYKDNKVYAVYEIKATHGYKQYKHSKEQLHRAKMLYTDAYLIYVARSHHEIVAKIVR
jgi:Holliday junction resolvase-like predicted endonuclease